jgi:hypothetical protein
LNRVVYSSKFQIDQKPILQFLHFRQIILESQSQLNKLLPHESLETCLVTVKEEITFVDESSVVVKLEPEEDQIVNTKLTADPIVETSHSSNITSSKVKKKQKTTDAKSARNSSRKRKENSYDEEIFEEATEETPRKRGRPRKSTAKSKQSLDKESFLAIQKVETVENESRESSPGWFNDGPNTGGSDDDDFKPVTDDFEGEKKEVSTKPEIFALCFLCPKAKKVQFKDEDDQKIHNELVHEDITIPFKGPYKCKSCPKVIASEIKARRHIRQFHLFKNEKLCTTCGKTFYDRRAFYCHIDKNHGIRVSD